MEGENLEIAADEDPRYLASVLLAVGAGGTSDRVVQRLAAAGIWILPGDVELLVGRFEEQGFLRRSRDPQRGRPACVLSAAGTQWLLHVLKDGSVGSSAPDGSAISAREAEVEAERQQVERLRTDLLVTISHELRTPLTLVRTSIGLLLDSDPDEVMRRRLLRNIKQSADRMNALVTDLLDLARLRSQKAELHVRRIDLVDLVRGAATLMRPLLEQKQQQLHMNLPSPAPTLMGDPRRLERVLLNLLSNANKFAPGGAEIGIGVTEDPASVTFAVSDTGPGIAPTAQEHLFEQFYTGRTSSSSRSIGAGLGLPIAKGIVEAHGGRIWVESEEGAGATFLFSIPKEARLAEDLDEAAGGR